WVVIRPDDTVVIRIARSEMGQGTLTGLAQLVAEELDCDWSKVTTEYPTPGQNVARKRVWGDMSTGGSRGIRDSQDYVRKGGAAAREMLKQAAANEWKVPVSEVSASNSVITHTPSGRTTTYGKVAEAAAKVANMPGVKKVVQVGDSGVAVVANTWWQAKTALDALPIVWDEGPNAKVSSATIADFLKTGLDAEHVFVGNQNGDVKAAIAS